MKCREIIEKLEESYPPSMAEPWDNVGLLVGNEQKEVKRVFVALDVTKDTLAAAIAYQADLLITHHPLLFAPVKQIQAGNYIGSLIIQLIQHDISYYAMHTNFDICGMADLSAQYLALSNSQVLEITFEEKEKKEGIGRVGDLPKEMTVSECAQYVKEKLKLPQVQVYGDLTKKINKIAISTGSGKSMVDVALASKAELLVTGDIDYHTGIDAPQKGLILIDAGHYGTEYIFIAYMTQWLQKAYTTLEIKGMDIIQPYAVI